MVDRRCEVVMNGDKPCGNPATIKLASGFIVCSYHGTPDGSIKLVRPRSQIIEEEKEKYGDEP